MWCGTLALGREIFAWTELWHRRAVPHVRRVPHLFHRRPGTFCWSMCDAPDRPPGAQLCPRWPPGVHGHGETARDASGTRPFFKFYRVGRVRSRFSHRGPGRGPAHLWKAGTKDVLEATTLTTSVSLPRPVHVRFRFPSQFQPAHAQPVLSSQSAPVRSNWSLSHPPPTPPEVCPTRREHRPAGRNRAPGSGGGGSGDPGETSEAGARSSNLIARGRVRCRFSPGVMRRPGAAGPISTGLGLPHRRGRDVSRDAALPARVRALTHSGNQAQRLAATRLRSSDSRRGGVVPPPSIPLGAATRVVRTHTLWAQGDGNTSASASASGGRELPAYGSANGGSGPGVRRQMGASLIKRALGIIFACYKINTRFPCTLYLRQWQRPDAIGQSMGFATRQHWSSVCHGSTTVPRRSRRTGINGCGRVPDVSRPINFEEMDASRTGCLPPHPGEFLSYWCHVILSGRSTLGTKLSRFPGRGSVRVVTAAAAIVVARCRNPFVRRRPCGGRKFGFRMSLLTGGGGARRLAELAGKFVDKDSASHPQAQNDELGKGLPKVTRATSSQSAHPGNLRKTRHYQTRNYGAYGNIHHLSQN
eukprot:gene1593-biopygen19849